MLGLTLRRSLVVGLVYVIGLEIVLSRSIAGLRSLSVREFALSITEAVGKAAVQFTDPVVAMTTVWTMGTIILVASIAFSMRRLARYEVAERVTSHVKQEPGHGGVALARVVHCRRLSLATLSPRNRQNCRYCRAVLPRLARHRALADSVQLGPNDGASAGRLLMPTFVMRRRFGTGRPCISTCTVESSTASARDAVRYLARLRYRVDISVTREPIARAGLGRKSQPE
jgi:hypothetical protein